MGRTYFIEHKGTKILLVDFSGTKPGEEFYDSIEEAKKIIHSQPEKSVISLFDATDGHFDQEVINALKEFAKSNTPYIKTSALVGVTGLLNIALMTISRFAGRDFKTFKTREKALDWLITQ